MVVLYWIAGKGNYEQFVANRVNQGQRLHSVEPGGTCLPELWLKGPDGLSKPEM